LTSHPHLGAHILLPTSPMAYISVVLTGDQALVREALKALLQSQTHIQAASEVEPGSQAEARPGRLKPNLVILDLSKSLLIGLEAVWRIGRDSPAAKVLVLSSDAGTELQAQPAGGEACGCPLERPATGNVLRAVREIDRECHLFQGLTGCVKTGHDGGKPAIGNGHPSVHLTPRELEVLQLIAQSFANKQVAAALGISIKTVEKHRQHAMNKLHVHDTAGLTRRAIAMGLVEADAAVSTSL
jgi:DNA-binding NarL/FixJ family response regulator